MKNNPPNAMTLWVRRLNATATCAGNEPPDGHSRAQEAVRRRVWTHEGSGTSCGGEVGSVAQAWRTGSSSR